MILVYCNPISHIPTTGIVFGKDVRIPLSLTFGEPTSFQGTIYCDNVNGDDGVEFRFYDEDKTMFGFAVLGYDKRSVRTITDSEMPQPGDSQCYAACLFDHGTTFHSNKPVDIYKSDRSILVVIDKPILARATYYRLGDRLYVGLSEGGVVMCMLLTGLHPDNINDSF